MKSNKEVELSSWDREAICTTGHIVNILQRAFKIKKTEKDNFGVVPTRQIVRSARSDRTIEEIFLCSRLKLAIAFLPAGVTSAPPPWRPPLLVIIYGFLATALISSIKAHAFL